MHVFLQKIRAFISSMSIEHSKIAASGPSSLKVRFGDIHNDGDTIFVIVFNESMKSVDTVSFDGAIGSLYKLNWFYSRYSRRFFVILMSHSYFNDNNNLN